jgi:uncharacterized protein YidB (DUF937 family)
MSTKVSAIIVIDVTDICHEPLPVCQEIINYLQKFHSGCPETKAELTSALPRGNILNECPDAGWIQTPRNFASKYLFLGSFDRVRLPRWGRSHGWPAARSWTLVEHRYLINQINSPITMSLFDAVLASLNDPSRATQQSDLESLASAFSGGGASSANTGQIANLIGGFLKPMLQEQHAVGGAQGVDSFLQDIKQSANSPDQLRQVLGADRMDQMVGRAEQKTGLDASVIFRLLPIVLPAVIGLLQSGRPATTPTVTAATGATGAPVGGQTNPILAQFLDSDRDGDVDMADVVRLTSQFLQK